MNRVPMFAAAMGLQLALANSTLAQEARSDSTAEPGAQKPATTETTPETQLNDSETRSTEDATVEMSETVVPSDVVRTSNPATADAAGLEEPVEEKAEISPAPADGGQAETTPEAASTTTPTSTSTGPIEPASTEEPTVTADAAATAGPEDIERRLIYFGFGAGVGAGNFSDDTVVGSSAAQLNLRVGVNILDQYLVGLQVSLLGQYNGWTESEHTGSAMSSVMAEGMVFPVSHLPLSIAGGVGWGSGLGINRMQDKSGDPRVAALSYNGLSFMGGVGWDFFPGRGLNLGLQARYDGAKLPDIGTVSYGSINLWLNFY